MIGRGQSAQEAAPGSSAPEIDSLRGGNLGKSGFSGDVLRSPFYRWLAVDLKGLTVDEATAYLENVHENLAIIRASPEGSRLLQALEDVFPLPDLDGGSPRWESRYVRVADGTASDVKVVFRPNTVVADEARPLNLSAASNGRGSAAILDFDAESYVPARATDGTLFLMRPAETLAHELVHVVHYESGTLVLAGRAPYIAAIGDPDGGEPWIEEHPTPVEEEVTQGAAAALAAVEEQYPLPRGFDAGGRKVTAFEAAADRVASGLAYTGSEASQEVREQSERIRIARRNAWGLNETGIVGGMKVGPDSVPTPVRGHYADFDRDLDNPAMYTKDSAGKYEIFIYRIPGSQLKVPLEYRMNRNMWAFPPPGARFPPEKRVASSASCSGGLHVVACEDEVTRTELSPEERAAAVAEFPHT